MRKGTLSKEETMKSDLPSEKAIEASRPLCVDEGQGVGSQGQGRQRESLR